MAEVEIPGGNGRGEKSAARSNCKQGARGREPENQKDQEWGQARPPAGEKIQAVFPQRQKEINPNDKYYQIPSKSQLPNIKQDTGIKLENKDRQGKSQWQILPNPKQIPITKSQEETWLLGFGIYLVVLGFWIWDLTL
jgi:hypothetical protein